MEKTQIPQSPWFFPVGLNTPRGSDSGLVGLWGEGEGRRAGSLEVYFLVALPFLQPSKCTQSFSPHITKTPKYRAHRKAPGREMAELGLRLGPWDRHPPTKCLALGSHWQPGLGERIREEKKKGKETKSETQAKRFWKPRQKERTVGARGREKGDRSQTGRGRERM